MEHCRNLIHRRKFSYLGTGLEEIFKRLSVLFSRRHGFGPVADMDGPVDDDFSS
jgi:hypothetical protein